MRCTGRLVAAHMTCAVPPVSLRGKHAMRSASFTQFPFKPLSLLTAAPAAASLYCSSRRRRMSACALGASGAASIIHTLAQACGWSSTRQFEISHPGLHTLHRCMCSFVSNHTTLKPLTPHVFGSAHCSPHALNAVKHTVVSHLACVLLPVARLPTQAKQSMRQLQ